MRKKICFKKLKPCPKRSTYYALKCFYQKMGISDLDELSNKIRFTMAYLKETPFEDVYRVGMRLLNGKKTPIAMLRDPNEKKPIMIKGKPYLRDVGDWVVLIQTSTRGYIVIEHCNFYIPDGWSDDDKDFILNPPTYKMFTDDRIKDVLDTLN